MPQKKSPKKLSAKRSHRLSRLRLFLLLPVLLASVTATWWGYVSWYEPNHLPSTPAYNNLDLSIARKAVYTNQPIHKIKDLGFNQGVHHELVSFNVPKDGLSEFALMTLPKTAPLKGRYPVIVLCHGYAKPSSYSTLSAYLSEMEFYSQHGYAVIKPDYRGQGFSLTSGSPDGAYYSMAYNTDVLSLIAAVKTTSYLDKSKINLWGHSMGGYVALRAAVLSKDIKNVILVSAPVGTSRDMYADYDAVSDRANSIAAAIRVEQIQMHGTPLSNPDYWDKTSPLNYLTNSKIYFQIHVGTADKIVPPEFSADLNSVLSRNHIAHSYYVYPGGTHGLIAQQQIIWQHSLNALSKN